MTAATLTLSDFLLARIAEDEAVARAHGERHVWMTPGMNWGGEWSGTIYPAPLTGYAEPGMIVPRSRVLAECEAKRRIVELHDYTRWVDVNGPTADVCTDGEVDVDGEPIAQPGRPQHPCATLIALALPYGDHPDYRPEWRP